MNISPTNYHYAAHESLKYVRRLYERQELLYSTTDDNGKVLNENRTKRTTGTITSKSDDIPRRELYFTVNVVGMPIITV